MNGPSCIAALGIVALIIISIAMAGGQTYQAATKVESVQVCNPNCHWEIQTVLK